MMYRLVWNIYIYMIYVYCILKCMQYLVNIFPVQILLEYYFLSNLIWCILPEIVIFFLQYFQAASSKYIYKYICKHISKKCQKSFWVWHVLQQIVMMFQFLLHIKDRGYVESIFFTQKIVYISSAYFLDDSKI